MPKIPFDDWLHNRINNHDSNIDVDLEWDMLAPKLNQKKSKRRFFIWFFLGFGILSISVFYGLNKHNLFEGPAKQSEGKDQSINFKSITDKDGNNNILADNGETKTKLDKLNMRTIESSIIIEGEQDDEILNASDQPIGIKKNLKNLNLKESVFSEINLVQKKILDSEHNDVLERQDPIDKLYVFETTQISYREISTIQLSQEEIDQLKNERIETVPSEHINSVKNNNSDRHYFSFQSHIGLYKNTFVANGSIAEKYIQARSKVEQQLESISLALAYNRRVGGSPWYWGLGIDFYQDSYWLKQSFKDTLDKTFNNIPTEIIKYADQSISVSKTGDAQGKAIYTVNRKVLGHRRIVGINTRLSYNLAFNDKNALEFYAGGSIGVRRQYQGLRIWNNENDIYRTEYAKTVDKSTLLSNYQIGLNYNYRINSGVDFIAGLKYQNEISGDHGLNADWQEKRKYLYIGTGINVYLNQ